MDPQKLLDDAGYLPPDAEAALKEEHGKILADTFNGPNPTYTFKVGDVVQLKSGGPQMTVTGMAHLYVGCSYFKADGMLVDSNFPPDALKPASSG
jgi:uncharacterized protein YodC (DUF2158 family)